MHDIDRIQQEFERAFDEYQLDASPFGEAEGETWGETPLLSEAEETELAAELLEVDSEQELEQFLGGLIRRAASAVGKAVKSPLGQALIKAAKPVVSAALPTVGTALGGALGGPLGASIGGKLAGAAGRLFGLELEGLSPEERELEIARRLVRSVGTATRSALQQPSGDPRLVARNAVLGSIRAVTPTGVSVAAGCAPMGAGSSHRGTWVRKGRKVILYGMV